MLPDKGSVEGCSFRASFGFCQDLETVLIFEKKFKSLFHSPLADGLYLLVNLFVVIRQPMAGELCTSKRLIFVFVPLVGGCTMNVE